MTRYLPIFLLGACAPDVPAAPSYQQHVAPILAANCVRCHGVPAIGGTYDNFRLDVYGPYDRLLRDGSGTETVRGASLMAPIIALRVASEDNPMPPRFGLDDYQIETLEAWAELGGPRGEPDPGNRPPTAQLLGALKSVAEDGVGTRVRYLIDVDVRDPDPDVVGGVLVARLGANQTPVGFIHSGPTRVVWDTTNLAQASYELFAIIDDGAAEIEVPVGTLDVEGP